jgi:glucose-6-phosphate dehydrogenase assembly protein OpcA
MSQHILQPITSAPARPVNVADIDRELLEMWKETDAQPGKQTAITRACMSNLVVYSDTLDEAAKINDELAVVAQHHPARVLHLIGETYTGTAKIQAQVSAFCSFLGSPRTHVCSEQITLMAAGGAKQRLPSVVRSLLIGDLPTALWWVPHDMPPPAGGEIFTELTAMSDQIIYESQGWLEPVRGVVTMASWAANEKPNQVLADLEWRRLKTWRRVISQALDPVVLPGALEAITEVRLEHGPHALAKTWQLVGWLAAKLGWQPEGGKVAPGEQITWRFRSGTGPVQILIRRLHEGEPKVQSGSITWKIGGQSHTNKIVRLGPGRLGLIGEDPNSPPRLQVVPSLGRPELVARQLPDLGRDDLFRETLQFSRTMAEALLH